MKLNPDNQQDAIEMARYLSGEMDEAERIEFESLIQGEEDNIKLMESMKSNWELLNKRKHSGNPDAAKAWNNLYSRLEAENLIPSASQHKFVVKKQRIFAIAAAILLLIAVGSVLILNTSRSRTKDIEMVQLNTQDENQTLMKTLDDGSIVFISRNSLFSFPAHFVDDKRNVELKGEAFFDVAHDPDKPFVVETAEAKIEVLGTAFNVKSGNGSNFELIVSRGKVKVTMKNLPGRSELVTAGEKVIQTDHRIVKSKCSSLDRPSWMMNPVHFKDEQLKNIIAALNRNFHTTFVLPDAEVGKRRLTVTFGNEPESTIRDVICVYLNLQSQVRNDSIVLSDKKTGAGK